RGGDGPAAGLPRSGRRLGTNPAGYGHRRGRRAGGRRRTGDGQDAPGPRGAGPRLPAAPGRRAGAGPGTPAGRGPLPVTLPDPPGATRRRAAVALGPRYGAGASRAVAGTAPSSSGTVTNS